LAKVVWTAEAEERLKEIHDYIALDKPAAAFRLVESIYRKVEILATFSDLGHRWLKRPGANIRILLHGHYRVPYRVVEGGDIHILGVFHGAMELKRYLRE
jgi:toxin ParE1/3/4